MKLIKNKWFKIALACGLGVASTAIVAPLVVSCGNNDAESGGTSGNQQGSYKISFTNQNKFNFGDKKLTSNAVNSEIIKKIVIQKHNSIFSGKIPSNFDWNARLKIDVGLIEVEKGTVQFTCNLDVRADTSIGSPEWIGGDDGKLITFTGFMEVPPANDKYFRIYFKGDTFTNSDFQNELITNVDANRIAEIIKNKHNFRNTIFDFVDVVNDPRFFEDRLEIRNFNKDDNAGTATFECVLNTSKDKNDPVPHTISQTITFTGFKVPELPETSSR